MNVRLLGAFVACVLTFFTTQTFAVTLSLESRLGGLAYYDPNLDITWAADANINGQDTQEQQVFWAASLTIGGVSGWRLASADVNDDTTLVDCFGGGVVGCADNEMGYLYWEEGITPTTPGPFSNLQSGSYWSGTYFAPSPSAWYFYFGNGGQDSFDKYEPLYAWAVHSGDVGTPIVPVPATVWLFVSGLVGITGISRRKKSA